MSRTAPRTGGKAAPKGTSPPRDAATGGSAASEAAGGGSGADALRTRRRSSEHAGGAGGNDDATGKGGASHWTTLRDLMEHKTLLQALMRSTKPIHANVSDAARNELNVPKRAVLHACSYALSVPATLADQPRVMSALSYADRGIGWVYDRTHGSLARLEAEGERVAAESGKAFDATISGKAQPAPPVAGNGGGFDSITTWLWRLTAVMVYVAVSVARGVVDAAANPRAAADAIKAGAANAVSVEQWKLRLQVLWDSLRRMMPSRNASPKGDAEPGGSGPAQSALFQLIGAVALVLMPWRPVTTPAQRAQ